MDLLKFADGIPRVDADCVRSALVHRAAVAGAARLGVGDGIENAVAGRVPLPAGAGGLRPRLRLAAPLPTGGVL